MKIAAIVGVKDERDLIRPCLERLWAIGVGPILVLDDGSTDGTRDVVESVGRRSEGLLEHGNFSPDFNQNRHLQGEVFAPFLQRHSPDRLLFIDADEFVLCAGDDLSAVFAAADHSVVSIPRYNVPLTPEPFMPTVGLDAADFAVVPLLTETEMLTPDLLDEEPTRRWIMHRILPKLAVRPDSVARYGLGWHSATDVGGQPIPDIAGRGIVIAHVPLTTKERFQRKVANARDFFRRWAPHFPGGAAWHWKRWIDLADRGLLDQEFEAQRFDEAALRRLCRMGVVQTAGSVIQASLDGSP